MDNSHITKVEKWKTPDGMMHTTLIEAAEHNIIEWLDLEDGINREVAYLVVKAMEAQPERYLSMLKIINDEKERIDLTR